MKILKEVQDLFQVLVQIIKIKMKKIKMRKVKLK